MALLEIADVRKSFRHQVVVQGFDLAVERGEFVSFLGPSGCGKTTTCAWSPASSTRPLASSALAVAT
jgi:ABC-type Fe3+/spermidine/putrescine transport system ATPase subunit